MQINWEKNMYNSVETSTFKKNHKHTKHGRPRIGEYVKWRKETESQVRYISAPKQDGILVAKKV